MVRSIPFAAVIFAALSVSADAQTAVAGDAGDSAVFGFAGRYTSEYIEYSLIPFAAGYDDTYVIGGGYQHFFSEPLPDLRIGAEGGIAARIGSGVTGEIWGGGVVRYDGFVLGDDWQVSPSLTFGLSAVSGSFGTEAVREAQAGGDARLLFYLAPEISFSNEAMGNTEIFYRLHHRSGAWGTVGGMGSGYNAQVIGLRQHF